MWRVMVVSGWSLSLVLIEIQVKKINGMGGGGVNIIGAA